MVLLGGCLRLWEIGGRVYVFSLDMTKETILEPSRAALPRLVVDTREQRPLCFHHLESVRGTLATGDYSIEHMENDFMVERKSVVDLLHSLSAARGRFFRELARMRAARCARLLIVGRPLDLAAELQRRGIVPGSVAGSLEAINARFCPVVWAATPERAAALVERLAVYYWAGAAKPFLPRVEIPAWARAGALASCK